MCSFSCLICHPHFCKSLQSRQFNHFSVRHKVFCSIHKGWRYESVNSDLQKVFNHKFHTKVVCQLQREVKINIWEITLSLLFLFLMHLNKRSLTRPKTTIAWKFIHHRSRIPKNWKPSHWVPQRKIFRSRFLLIQK